MSAPECAGRSADHGVCCDWAKGHQVIVWIENGTASALYQLTCSIDFSQEPALIDNAAPGRLRWRDWVLAPLT